MLFSLLLVSVLFHGNTEAMAAPPPTIHVRLFESMPVVREVELDGNFKIITADLPPARRYRLSTRQGQLFLQTLPTGKTVLRIQKLHLQALNPRGIRLTLPGRPARHYPGQVHIQPGPDNNLIFTNQVPAPLYVAIVVGSETTSGWPTEALKAQAVLTQTRLSRYKPGDSLGDSTQQEAYLGSGYLRPPVQKAVEAVWGEILTYRRQPITPYYHASCAGHTSDGRFFGKAQPWLTAVPCPYCRQAPFAQPTVHTVPWSIFSAKMGTTTLPLQQSQDTAQRPLRFQVNNQTHQSGYALWLKLGQSLGWDKAPGTRFTLTRQGENVIIRSTGAGHGVGLCQHGAAALARQGKSYRDILHYYYPNALISKRF